MNSIVIVLLVCLVSSGRTDERADSSSRRNGSRRMLDLEPPEIEALFPKGVRIFLRDREGMQLFAFHGKINSPIGKTENGNIARDVTRPEGGYWVIEDPNIKLRIGDVINYWIFVQVNGLGYRFDNLSKIIKERKPANRKQETHHEESDYHTSSSSSSSTSSGNKRITVTTTTTTTDCNCDLSELRTITGQLNLTLTQVNNLNNKVTPMQVQIESLTELIQELIKDQNIGTQLLLVGRTPPVTNAVEAIRQLITEKLDLVDLENKIQQAYSTSEGIYFEMSSSIDKKRILFRAGKRLQNSRYKILDPQADKSRNFGLFQVQRPLTYVPGDMTSKGRADQSSENRRDSQSDRVPENSSLDRNKDENTTESLLDTSSSRDRENLISHNGNGRKTQSDIDESMWRMASSR